MPTTPLTSPAMSPIKIRIIQVICLHYTTTLSADHWSVFATLTRYPLGVYYLYMIDDIKRRALHRSRILQGQLKGVEKMIDNEAYCMDIITQSLAIQKSLASLNKLILENHLRTHIKDALSTGDEPTQSGAIHELLALYELTNLRTNNK